MPYHTPLSRAASGAALAILCVLPRAVGAQADPVPERAQVSGRVVSRTGVPLAGATVRLEMLEAVGRPGRTTRTDGSGVYRFQAVAPGRYALHVSYPAYEAARIEVQVAPGATVTLSATLDPVREPETRGDTGTVVTGRVTDAATGEPVAGAVVSIEGAELSSQTDADGRYRLQGAPSGPQMLRVRIIGYAQRRVALTLPVAGTQTQDIALAANPLLIEGIVVTADPVGRARGELATASVIDREAIKHQTATSLAGVLELTPGVPIQPPGLDNLQQIALRTVPTSGAAGGSLPGAVSPLNAAAFGTLIVLDGVPVSNNANLQSLGPRGELGFTTAAGGGIDLRQIPASTLERVEVIRGVPSARWGDLTQGAVIVETRAGAVEAELAGQLDMRTGEASVVGGRALGGRHTATLTYDFASTRTAPGQADDHAYRVAAQLLHRADLGRRTGADGEPALRLDTRADFFQLFDDRPPNPNTARTASSSSRDRGIRVHERLRARIAGARLNATAGYTLVQQRYAATSQKTRTALPFTDRLAEGRQEGFFVIGPYEAAVELDGNPALAFGRVELRGGAGWLGLAHEWLSGLEARREWNSGPGYQFDIQFPPQSRFNGVNGYDRPRPFDDIPALATSALYLDDRLRASAGPVDVQLQAGVRLDVLHEGGWTGGVRDAVLQPRANLEVAPVRWLRLRGAYGHLAKSPPLRLLYPAPQYYDVVNVNYFTNDPVERYAVLTTFIRDPTNPDLEFARARKAEVGIELGVGASVISLVAFDDRISGGFGVLNELGVLLRDRYALTDSVTGNGIKPEIIEPPTGADTIPVLIQRPANVLQQTSRGLELTAFLPEVALLRTRLQVTGAWVETRQEDGGLYFGSAADFGNFQLQETNPRTPYWGPAIHTGKRALLQYRLIHHQPHAGLVLTATIQHNVTDGTRAIASTDTLAFFGYITRDARLVPVPPDERGADQYADLRRPRGGILVEPSAAPADWMMSVQVSKTLPLDGRLNFWAFNALDRLGIRFTDPSVRPRIYPPIRVGLELMMPARALWGWAH